MDLSKAQPWFTKNKKKIMPVMKKVYNPVCDFCIPEKRCCFRVRVNVQTSALVRGTRNKFSKFKLG
jgi:hypothetical protein